MMREEFEYAVTKLTGDNDYFRTHALSVQDYTDIEYVYTWHPAISETKGKEQIAWLYVNLGMCVIRDMYETASLYEDLDDELRAAQDKVKSLENRIERLRRGDKGYESDEEN